MTAGWHNLSTDFQQLICRSEFLEDILVSYFNFDAQNSWRVGLAVIWYLDNVKSGGGASTRGGLMVVVVVMVVVLIETSQEDNICKQMDCQL